jgi:hypothetical protein
MLVISLAKWHGLVNYIDIKAKRRHLKELTCKGTSSRCLSVFIDCRLEIQSVMWVFPTQLCELLPL